MPSFPSSFRRSDVTVAEFRVVPGMVYYSSFLIWVEGFLRWVDPLAITVFPFDEVGIFPH